MDPELSGRHWATGPLTHVSWDMVVAFGEQPSRPGAATSVLEVTMTEARGCAAAPAAPDTGTWLFGAEPSPKPAFFRLGLQKCQLSAYVAVAEPSPESSVPASTSPPIGAWFSLVGGTVTHQVFGTDME